MKRIVLAIVTVLCTTCIAATTMAADFSDVPPEHWAYPYVNDVVSLGFMSKDASGKFNPDALIDKFETSKILACAAGYKYSGISSSELAEYNAAYEKHKSLLKSCATAYTKWNSSTDREIAYLLEKEIYTPEDLNQFIVKDAEKNEKLRALSREEAAVFLVRLIEKRNEALTATNTSGPFVDDTSITVSRKPYVYYLKDNDVIAGGTDGRFNPNSAVTRAAMAVLLDKTLALENISSAPQTPGVNVTSVSGVFETYYMQQGVQITLNDGTKRIYKLAPSTTVYIDGYLKTADDLKQGMPLVAVVVGDDIVTDIKAMTLASDMPLETDDTLFVEGVVSAVTSEGGKTIDVDVRMLNPHGEVILSTRKFSVADTVPITRGGEKTDFSAIVNGDVIRVDYTGSAAKNIAVEQKNRTFEGVELVEKNNEVSPTITIKDASGKTFALRITDESVITRNGETGVIWSNLRLGDTLSATAEYDALVTAVATGEISSVSGTVQEIHITKNLKSIVLLKSNNGAKETYGFIDGAADIYALRLNDVITVTLDSKEVQSFVNGQVVEPQNNPAPVQNGLLTGYIQSNTDGVAKIGESKTGGTATDVTIDAHTIAINESTGARINPNTLSTGLKVTVEFVSDASNVAKTITVIAD